MQKVWTNCDMSKYCIWGGGARFRNNILTYRSLFTRFAHFVCTFKLCLNFSFEIHCGSWGLGWFFNDFASFSAYFMACFQDRSWFFQDRSRVVQDRSWIFQDRSWIFQDRSRWQNWKSIFAKTKVGFGRTELSLRLSCTEFCALSSGHGPRGRGFEGRG